MLDYRIIRGPLGLDRSPIERSNNMERYDYLENVKNDVLSAIQDCNHRPETYEDSEDFKSRLMDELWCNDSVTGNGSGSYTCNAWMAEEYICHNLELLDEALMNFGCQDVNICERGAEWADVTIRCYLLSQAINEVIDEIWGDINPNDSDNDEED